jgi:hypothetical protein
MLKKHITQKAGKNLALKINRIIKNNFFNNNILIKAISKKKTIKINLISKLVNKLTRVEIIKTQTLKFPKVQIFYK